MSNVHKLKQDNLDEFSPQELNLILKHNHIFANKDAELCPKCEREKSPKTGIIDTGPCLYCIEEALKKRKQVLIKHLPERWPADAHMIQMSHELIENYHPEASKAAIAYIMKQRHTESNGKIVLGSCAKQSPKNKLLHGWDFIIEIAWDMWALFGDREREALLLHEIVHIKEDDGQWKINPHSVEEHVKVIENYGLWKPDLQMFAEAIRQAEIDDDRQGRLPFGEGVNQAAKNFTDSMNEGDSIEFSGQGLEKRKLVKSGGRMVEDK